MTSDAPGERLGEFRFEASICDPASAADQTSRTRIGASVASIESGTSVRFDLADFAGEDVMLCFSARRLGAKKPAPGGVSVLWLANATLGTREFVRWVPTQPNLLLITLDTTRADHLSSAGYPRRTTPNLDGLARDGEQFLNAVANSALTLPSHGSLFTGLHPREHGARPDPQGEHMRIWTFNGLSPKLLTLAEQFWMLGYRTAGVVGGPMLSQEFGFAQGFDYYHEPSAGLGGSETSSKAGAAADAEEHESGDADEITDRALAWLDERNGVFFLFLNYFDPHWPYDAPDQVMPSWIDPDQQPYSPKEQSRIWHAVMGGRRELGDSERRTMISYYDAEIASMDRSIGRLLDSLKERGLYDSTMIVVVSDHGEAFGEHQLLDHGNSLYEHQLRSGLIIKYPVQHDQHSEDRKGKRYDHRVDLLDLHATILRELGLIGGFQRSGKPPTISGRLRDYGVHKKRSYHFAELRQNAWYTAAYGPRFERDLEAVYHEAWKLIRDEKGHRWLFDLATDPLEQKNLAASQPEVLDRLDGWAQSEKRLTPDEAPASLSPGLIERLRELGYLGPREDG